MREQHRNKYIIVCKIVSGDLLFDAGHPKLVLFNKLEEWDGEGSGWGFRREATYVYLWPIHVDVCQEPSQYCKVIIL